MRPPPSIDPLELARNPKLAIDDRIFAPRVFAA